MLELYQREDCPFCRKVRVVLNELELDYICRISHTGSKQREIMLKLGGQPQVPFLVDQDKGILLYESDAIVEYLHKTYGKSTQDEADNSPKVCPIE
jgi:glutathione S-transferase